MSKFSRDKGARGERECLGMLREHLGDIVPRRSLVSSRSGGHDTEIIAGWPWALEIKNRSMLNVRAWWGQAIEQAVDAELVPALAYKVPQRSWPVRGWWFVVPSGVLMGEAWRPDDFPAQMDVAGFVQATHLLLPQPAPAPSGLTTEELEMMP